VLPARNSGHGGLPAVGVGLLGVRLALLLLLGHLLLARLLLCVVVVMTLGTTHQFSSTSPPHAAPELPTTPSRDLARSPDMPGAMSLNASLCVPAQIRIALAQIADAIGHPTSTD
jgi:hypothetical protein